MIYSKQDRHGKFFLLFPKIETIINLLQFIVRKFDDVYTEFDAKSSGFLTVSCSREKL